MAETSNSDDEKKLFDYIANDDIENVRKCFDGCKINVDVVDEHGMTPLKHAAYKGNAEICQYLLDRGADVNCDRHEHGYTALHFGVLSGSTAVCQLLLEAGAKTHRTNSVGRTAAQMAGFIGNHHCSSVINNFVAKSDIEYYSIPRGTETMPKISPKCIDPLHKLVMQVNIHPIKIALTLAPPLTSELPGVQKVLNLLSAKEMSRGAGNNEILSFKYHYLSYMIGELSKYYNADKPSDMVDLFAKKILRNTRGDEYLDSLIRDAAREFTYRECTLFRQICTDLVQAKDIVGSAVAVVAHAITGERFGSDEVARCATCAEIRPAKRCAKCKVVSYCDRQCQRLHWPVHKKECARQSGSPPDNMNEPVPTPSAPLEELVNSVIDLST